MVAFFEYEQEGPVGGTGGGPVPPWAMPVDGVITLVEVKYGLYLNQLVFHYTSSSNGDGAITLGGYDPGSNHVQFSLAKGEEVHSLQGRYGSYVDSIQVITSTRTYPPAGSYGGAGGAAPYVFNVPKNGRLAGLFGRAGAWMDALGVVYVVPIRRPQPPPIHV